MLAWVVIFHPEHRRRDRRHRSGGGTFRCVLCIRNGVAGRADIPYLLTYLLPYLPFPKSLSCNTYASPRKCCKQKTYGLAKPFRCNTYKKHGVPPSSQKLFSFFFPVLSSTPLGASHPMWLTL